MFYGLIISFPSGQWTHGNLSDDTQRYALHIIQQLSLRRRDERLVRPQQSRIIIPLKKRRGEEETRSVAKAGERGFTNTGAHSQPFGETSELRAHLPYRTTCLQRLEFRKGWDALFQGARETAEDFGSVEGGGTRPYAGLEGIMGIDDRAFHVVRVGCVDTAAGYQCPASGGP